MSRHKKSAVSQTAPLVLTTSSYPFRRPGSERDHPGTPAGLGALSTGTSVAGMRPRTGRCECRHRGRPTVVEGANIRRSAPREAAEPVTLCYWHLWRPTHSSSPLRLSADVRLGRGRLQLHHSEGPQGRGKRDRGPRTGCARANRGRRDRRDQCRRGTPSCRGTVSGRDWQRPDLMPAAPAAAPPGPRSTRSASSAPARQRQRSPAVLLPLARDRSRGRAARRLPAVTR
jgi:hypothetical protein